jgi:hypothetical protein
MVEHGEVLRQGWRPSDSSHARWRGLQPRFAELRKQGVCEGHMEGQSLAWSGGSEDTGIDALEPC